METQTTYLHNLFVLQHHTIPQRYPNLTQYTDNELYTYPAILCNIFRKCLFKAVTQHFKVNVDLKL